MTSHLEQLCEKYGVPVVDLSAFSAQPDAIGAVSLTLALRLKIVPLSKIGCVLTIVVSDPLALPAIDEVKFHTGLRVETVVAPAKDIASAISRFYGVPEEDGDAEVADVEVVDVKTVDDDDLGLANLYKDAASALQHVPRSCHGARVHHVVVPRESAQQLVDAALKALRAKG
jgi:type IV pilus assembly protein PilB